MKNDDILCELVQEYVKKWAWEGRLPGEYDQIYISGKQCKAEYMLFGKVEYIITDSPSLMGPFYDHWYNQYSLVEEMVSKYIAKTQENGVEHINFLINRTKKYVQAGRFNSEKQAHVLDSDLRGFLDKHNQPYHEITSGNVDEAYDFLKNNIMPQRVEVGQMELFNE